MAPLHCNTKLTMKKQKHLTMAWQVSCRTI